MQGAYVALKTLTYSRWISQFYATSIHSIYKLIIKLTSRQHSFDCRPKRVSFAKVASILYCHSTGIVIQKA